MVQEGQGAGCCSSEHGNFVIVVKSDAMEQLVVVPVVHAHLEVGVAAGGPSKPYLVHSSTWAFSQQREVQQGSQGAMAVALQAGVVAGVAFGLTGTGALFLPLLRGVLRGAEQLTRWT